MKRNESDKLEARSDKYNFVGYPKKTKGYFFYNPLEQKVFVLRNATFLENEILSERSRGRRIELGKAQELQIDSDRLDDVEQMSNAVGVETQPTLKH